MVDKTILEVVDYFAECLRERGLNISKIILFGSYAYGIPTKESDIDLVVVSEDFTGKGIFERADMLGDAEYRTIKKFVVPMDVVTMAPEDLESETSLMADYAKQGKVIFPSNRRRASKQIMKKQ